MATPLRSTRSRSNLSVERAVSVRPTPTRKRKAKVSPDAASESETDEPASATATTTTTTTTTSVVSNNTAAASVSSNGAAETSSAASSSSAAAAAAGLVTPSKSISNGVPGSASSRVGSSGSAVPLTPNRAARLDEKNELQELNKRFELYILKMRERDSNSGGVQKMVDDVRARAAVEMEAVRTLAAQQLADIRTQRDSALLKAADAEEKLKRVSEQLKERTSEIGKHKTYTAGLDSQASTLAADLATQRGRVLALELQVKSLEAALETHTNNVKQLEIELKKQRERADRATSSESVATAAARTAKEDYQLLTKKYQQETKQLAQQVAALTSGHTSVEETLRKEFSSQLEQLLQERLRQFEEEKESGLNELRTVYESKLVSYRESLEQVGSDIESEKKRFDIMRTELSKAQALAAEAVANRDALTKRVSELSASLDTIHSRHAAEVADKTTTITRIKAIFRKKDEEFEELMGVKIALAMEIKAYRQMLDREEERLGYGDYVPTGTTPARGTAPASASKSASKSSSTAAATAASSSSSSSSAAASSDASKKRKVSAPADKTEKLSIERVDLDRQFVVVRNSTTDASSMRGWLIRTREGKDEFRFPATLVLQPGNTVTVWCGKQFKAKEKAPTDLVWAADAVWHAHGDAALLVNSSGDVVSRVEVINKH